MPRSHDKLQFFSPHTDMDETPGLGGGAILPPMIYPHSGGDISLPPYHWPHRRPPVSDRGGIYYMYHASLRTGPASTSNPARPLGHVQERSVPSDPDGLSVGTQCPSYSPKSGCTCAGVTLSPFIRRCLNEAVL